MVLVLGCVQLAVALFAIQSTQPLHQATAWFSGMEARGEQQRVRELADGAPLQALGGGFFRGAVDRLKCGIKPGLLTASASSTSGCARFTLSRNWLGLPNTMYSCPFFKEPCSHLVALEPHELKATGGVRKLRREPSPLLSRRAS